MKRRDLTWIWGGMLVLVSASAQAATTRCSAMKINDQDVVIYVRGDVTDRETLALDDYEVYSKGDVSKKKYDKVKLEVLKKVPFETYSARGDDGVVYYETATYKLKVTADGQASIGVVVCETVIRDR